MTTHTPHDELLAGRYVGQSVTRREDAALLTGSASFVDDLSVPQMLYAVFVRSDVARGRIARLDTTAARSADGAVAVLTAADLEPHRRGPMTPTLYLDARGAPLRPLASDDVRFVGDPVAIAVSTSRYGAADAAELVCLDVDAEPPVLEPERAVSGGAVVHRELGTNLASRTSIGATGTAADGAAHVVRATFRQQRQSAAPLEPRGVLAWWHPETASLDVWISSPVRSRNPVLMNMSLDLTARMHSLRFTVVRRSSSMTPTLTVFTGRSSTRSTAVKS